MGFIYSLNVYLSLDFWHMHKEHINIFPDEISALSVTQYDSIGLKSGKKSINWVLVDISETLR